MLLMEREFNIEIYRITFKGNRSLLLSERFFQAQTSSEALKDFYFIFFRGRIHSKSVTITNLQVYNRFSNKWIDRMNEAVTNLPKEITECMKIKSDKIRLTRD